MDDDAICILSCHRPTCTLTHASLWHRYRDKAPQRQRGHDLDFLGSRDVIGHVTIRLAVDDFLWVVHCDHASLWHRYREMAI